MGSSRASSSSDQSLPAPATAPAALRKSDFASTSSPSMAASTGSVATSIMTKMPSAVCAIGGAWFLFLALISMASGTALDLVLQALSLSSVVHDGPWLVFLLTIAEFGGCCLIALACGGRLSLDGDHDDDNGEADEARLTPEAKAAPRSARRTAGRWLQIILLGLLLCCVKGLPNLAGPWLQYPIKVLINSMRLIPTMVVSQLVGNSRRFSHTEYVSATICCLGIAAASVMTSHLDVPAGLVCLGTWLLLSSVLADVINVNVQQVLMQKRGVSPMSLLLCQNFVGLVVAFVGMCVTIDLPSIVKHFMNVHEVELYFVIAIAAANAATSWAYIHLVNLVGCVSQAGLLTLRKLVAVALSYVFFPKPFKAIQPLGFFMTVGGLSLGCSAPAPKAHRPRGWKHHGKNPKNCPVAACGPSQPSDLASGSGLPDAERAMDEPLYERAEEVATEIISAFAGEASEAHASQEASQTAVVCTTQV